MARILIAEDEPTFRDLLADILEVAGHAVVAVGDGETALAALERGGFELLLTDQRMPRLGGLELLRRLRALPGVQSVAIAQQAVLENNSWSSTIRVEGYQHKEDENMNPNFNTIGSGFFSAMKIPVVAGREFSAQDAAGAMTRSRTSLGMT